MAATSLPLAGTRDFGPAALQRRLQVMRMLERTFLDHGFAPLQTPAMERLEVLMGSYGAEGQALLYKVLDAGDFLSKATEQDWQEGAAGLLPKIASRGLRYDLTVPLARYVAQHHHELPFPFKRFQMQPVWRADRPQKGRYREFYQCDIDVVGSRSCYHEAELLVMIYQLFRRLGLTQVVCCLNHRGVLEALAAWLGLAAQGPWLYRTLDKLDKIGWSGVAALLHQAGVAPKVLDELHGFLLWAGSLPACLTRLAETLGHLPAAAQALEELEAVAGYLEAFDLPQGAVRLVPALARGMSYYTGALFEVRDPAASLGSLAGGGRYAALTERFGLRDMPGVGISVGFERLCDLLEARGLLGEGAGCALQLLLAPLEPATEPSAIAALRTVRHRGVRAELYPAGAKVAQVFRYAERRGLPWVALLGGREANQHRLALKHLPTRQQFSVTLEGLLARLGQPPLA